MGQFFEELKRRNVLRVVIAYLAGSWLLIQVLETLFPVFGLPETAFRVVVIGLAILFVPAVILAWIFEVTPQGIQRDADATRAAEGIPANRKALDNVIIVTLTLALGYFAVDKFIIDPAKDRQQVEAAKKEGRADALIESYGDNSIVVLPFVNMSSDPEQEYFSDGIAEELLNLLAKIKELRVISRSSAFAFKGKDVDIATIAQRLKVSHVLEGSVRKSGNRIRITTQLIDAHTDTHLWSETYDRELDDIFAIQDEISAQVVEQLKITILGDLPKAEQIDAEAYSLFLRGQHIVHTGQWDKLPLAEQLLKEALEIEPEYVRALGILGQVYRSYDSDTFDSEDDRRRLIRELAARVSAAEPDGVIDLAWRAHIAAAWDHDLLLAASLFERALTLEPGNPGILLLLTGFLATAGYLEESIATSEYIVLRDPACVYCLMMLSINYRNAGRYDRAIEVLQDAVAWAPDRVMINWSLGSLLLQAGKPAEALVAFEQETAPGMAQFGRLFALHDLGRLQEFEEEFALYRAENGDLPEDFARIYAWTGNNDLALEWLEKLVATHGPDSLRNITVGGFYDKLFLDPRFDALLRKYGWHPETQEKISFNFTPPE